LSGVDGVREGRLYFEVLPRCDERLGNRVRP
jgi:hypothetical protein